MKNNSFGFEPDVYKTERTANQHLVEWINQIIKEDGLPFGLALQETTAKDRKQPDIILFKEPQSKEVLLVAELKPTYFNPLDFEAVKKPAWEKAVVRKAPYFATSNFKTLYLFSTQRANEMASDLKQLVNKYDLSCAKDLEDLDNLSIKLDIIKNLRIFLKDLKELAFDKKEQKQKAVDEWLVCLLREHVLALTERYKFIIQNSCLNDKDFRKKVIKWFNDQGWDYVDQPEYFARAARQTAYWLATKILFYDVLQASDPQNYIKLKIPEEYTKGEMSQKLVQSYFDEVLKIDYETIFTTDFIDQIAFPEDKVVVSQIRKLANDLNEFDFSTVGYDVLGRIFENILPWEERQTLGQFYTSPDVVDIILRFAIRGEKDTILDPGCGAGTFLKRGYRFKKLENSYLTHEQILPTLWGNDIDKLACGLATINLATEDLKSTKNYPRVTHKDFFNWKVGDLETIGKQKATIAVKSLEGEQIVVSVPRYFDAIVGNPPYTRQEKMDDFKGKSGQDYKEDLIARAVLDENGRPYAKLSKRAGLYAYFFTHATKLLKTGGRFGFVVSNSWMDASYGAGLQEHFLKHYKIKAIIESKVERWFSHADINTCIVCLEKSNQENGNNLVKFVTLKKPLTNFMPKASTVFEETIERKDAVDNFWKNIESHNSFLENDDIRIYLKPQSELWNEGVSSETGEYTGSKWGKYLRAPEIYFKILEKAKEKLVPLKTVATVRFGIKTGANEFFYLTEEEIKRRKIEEEFWTHKNDKGETVPNYIIKSPKECKTLVVNPADLKYRVLMVHKDRKELKGTKMLEYIKEGETMQENPYHKRTTLASRKNWWDLGNTDSGGFLYPMIHNERQAVFLNLDDVFVDHNMFEIKPFNIKDLNYIFAFHASTFGLLFRELGGRISLGEGALKTEGVDLQELTTIDPKFMSNDTKGKIDNWIKDNKEKKEVNIEILERILATEVLNLNEDNLKELRESVDSLISQRLKKAVSVDKEEKYKGGVNYSSLVKSVVNKIASPILGNFYKKHVLSKPNLTDIELIPFAGSIFIDKTLIGWQVKSGKEILNFETEEQAKYCALFVEAGWDLVKIPSDLKILQELLLELDKIKTVVIEALNYFTEGLVNEKIKTEVIRLVWREVSKF